MLTRRRRPLVSPSLLTNVPAARHGASSPSLTVDAVHASIDATVEAFGFRPMSPSLDIAELAPSPVPQPSTSSRGSPSLLLSDDSHATRRQSVSIGSHNASMTLAVCKRASRMARPAEPSEAAMNAARAMIYSIENDLMAVQRLERLRNESGERFRLTCASTGKGPTVRADSVDGNPAAQQIINHMVAIKSRHVESSSQEPTWLVDVQSACPQMYGRLAAAAIKSNAVNSSVTKREKTQGAANQTSRINCKAIAQSAAAQASAVAVTMAIARAQARSSGVCVANPMATNEASATTLWKVLGLSSHADQLFAVTMSSRLVFNALPTKLGAGCVLSEARKLARGELEDNLISERMGSANYMLEGVCKAIIAPGEYQLDAVWASWVLVVYLCCHPEGRKLLRATALTDVDYQTATAFESYGRAEITRRARLDAQQAQSRKRKMSETPVCGPVNECPDAEVTAISKLASEERQVLATKRKRGAKGQTGASTSDSSGMLTWWFGALRCSNNSVLMSLIAHSKQAARDAASATLQRQADGTEGVADNLVIKGISEANAVSSAQALVPFVGRRAAEIPAALLWTWNGQEYRGFSRTSSEAHSTTLHACYLAPSTLQPATASNIRIAWSVASMQFAPRTNECATLPGILERMHDLAGMSGKGKRGEMMASRVSAMLLAEADPPRPIQLSGITRSVISMRVCISVHRSQLQIGVDLGNKLVGLKPVALDGEATDLSLPTVRAVDQDPESRKEPLCSPATRLALAIGVNEEIRTWMIGKTRKNDPCKVALGVITPQERARDAPAIINSEPPPLLTIVDYNLDLLPEAEPAAIEAQIDQSTDNVCPNVPFGTALYVCGDGVTRVPEILAALHVELKDKTDSSFALQARSILWGAMSQSSYISNVGSVICAGYANSAISSSKKISVADNHRLLFLTPFDVYSVGMTNLEPNHLSTPYAGTYGCCFDHGVSPPGHMAHNLRSDKRQHGNVCLSEPMADKLSARFAKAHWVKCNGGSAYCEAPPCTRGIPHNLTPGIHACLDEYLNALETLRVHSGRVDAPTVDSLCCLSFGPWSQALPPVVEATADLSMRLCVRDPALLSVQCGNAYLVDSTSEEEALLREPVFRRPCQASISDNPFATSYEHMDSFFNLANGIVLDSRCAILESAAAALTSPTRAMMNRVNNWVMHEHGLPVRNAVFCADVLLKLSLMYPQKHGIAESIVLPAWAAAVPALHRLVHDQRASRLPACGNLFGDLGLDAELVAQGRAWWSAFVRDTTGVWRHGPLGDLLQLLDENDGGHSVTREKIAEVRTALENSVKAAWLVASVDGVESPPFEHPASEAIDPRRVKRPTIDPVFVGDKRRGIRQRGCLVGIKPHQLRQVCALAMGAHLPDVKCQVARNEGGLSLRVSSAADILDEKGNERSAKSISPVQTEADEQAFGSRDDKLEGCALQRRAWDDNAELLTAVFVAVREPLPRERRQRGEMGVAYKKQEHATVRRRDQCATVSEEIDARRALEEAAASSLARLSREALG